MVGALIPHHLLVEKHIDQFYQKLAEENSDIQTVILLSPNHLGHGRSFMQTTDKFASIRQLLEHSPLGLETKSFEKEHGVYIHLPFLKKYFPKAKLIPIIFKKNTPENRLNILTKNLKKNITDNTLIIGSIDFTHYESEEIAVGNDNRTITWLENLKNKDIGKISLDEIAKLAKSTKQTNLDSVAFDSPESMYVLLKLLANYQSTNFTLFKRTSTLSLTKLTNPLDNTSHIFGEFKEPK